MVPPASDRVPRVRPYSGVICVSSASPTGILPSVSELSSPLRLAYLNRVMMILNPEASFGLASFPFARRYSENRCFFLFLRLLRCFSSPRSLLCSYVFTAGYMDITPCGFPHSEICGSQDMCSSPQLIAAYHVLRRLPVPRHPPDALLYLTSSSAALADYSLLFSLSVNSGFLNKLLLEIVTLLDPLSQIRLISIRCQFVFLFLLVCYSIFKVLHVLCGQAPDSSGMVENKGLEPLTPCVQGRCSPS